MNRVTFTWLCIVLMSALFSSDALAHKITVFCWFENGALHGEGYFNSGDPVQNSPVRVVNLESRHMIAETTTSEKGTFAVSVEDGAPIEVILDAGQGHRATWQSETGKTEEHKTIQHSQPEKTRLSSVITALGLIAALFAMLSFWKRRHAA